MDQVLLVDSNPSSRNVTAKAFLSNLAIKVTTAGSAKEAIDLIVTKKFSLIVSEFQIHDGTGADLLDFVSDKNIRSSFIIFTETSNLAIPKNNQMFLGVVKKNDMKELMSKAAYGIYISYGHQLKSY